LSVVLGFDFRWGSVVKLGVEALVIEPPDPFQSCQFDLFNGPPGAAFLDQFRLE